MEHDCSVKIPVGSDQAGSQHLFGIEFDNRITCNIEEQNH